MKSALPRDWPFLAGASSFALVVGLMLLLSLHRNAGHLTYALDDAYIHMAIAKNFSQHGVWGVTRYGFSSSTSSIVWPLLLSLTYALFGVHQASPLILNLVFGILVLLASYWILCQYRLAPPFAFAVLLVMIFVTPLPALVFDGCEHTLQTVVTILAAYLSARLLAESSPPSRRNSITLLCLAALVTGARFEGMFLILVIGGLFLLRGRWLYGLAFGLCGFLPVLIYGLISVSRGWMWLPNSVLLKGVFPDLTSVRAAILSLVGPSYVNMSRGPHVFTLIVAAVVLNLFTSRGAGGIWETRQVMTTIFVVVALFHLAFAAIGSFFRYEAYLVALGVLIAAAQLSDWAPKQRPLVSFDRTRLAKYFSVAILAVTLFFPLAFRGVLAMVLVPQATTNIYQQQYQMALFVRQFYPGSTIALNDIGAVNYFNDIHCLDLFGLANLEVARRKRRSSFHTVDISELASGAGARIALVYDSWFGGDVGGLPEAWVRVGKWTIRDAVVSGDSTVSIYAADASESSALVEHLRDFSGRLPPGVIQTGKYAEWVQGSTTTPP